MHKIFFLLLIAVSMLMSDPVPGYAQSAEAQQLVMDWQKLLELKNILHDMYQGYDILSKGYEHISHLSKDAFNLHKAFLDGLLLINPAVKNDPRIPEILLTQLELVKGYKQSMNRFRTYLLFTKGDFQLISAVYGQLLAKSLDDLNELSMVLTSRELRMSDAQRLSVIGTIDKDIGNQLSFLRSFDSKTDLLAIQLAKEKKDTQTLRLIEGLTP